MGRSPRPTRANPQNSDASLFSALGTLLTAPKTPSSPVAWVEDDQGNFRFSRPLEIDGVTEAGFVLFGRAATSLPGEDVTLGLRWLDMRAGGGHFDRLDWRPKHRHNNKGHGPPEFRHMVIDGTHHHRLADNAALPVGLAQAMRDNLPIAVPLEPEPDWPIFLAEAARCWNIPTLIHTPEPPWQYDLLTFPNTRDGKR